MTSNYQYLISFSEINLPISSFLFCVHFTKYLFIGPRSHKNYVWTPIWAATSATPRPTPCNFHWRSSWHQRETYYHLGRAGAGPCQVTHNIIIFISFINIPLNLALTNQKFVSRIISCTTYTPKKNWIFFKRNWIYCTVLSQTGDLWETLHK